MAGQGSGAPAGSPQPLPFPAMPGSRHPHTTIAEAAPKRAWATQKTETRSGIGPIDEVGNPEHPDGGPESSRRAATAAGRRRKGSTRTNRVAPRRLAELWSPEADGSISCGLARAHRASAEVTVTVDGSIRSGAAGYVDGFGSRFAE
jgi:hypothetical protein